MSKETVLYLTEELKGQIERKTQRNFAVPPHLQLLTALRFYAVGKLSVMNEKSGEILNKTSVDSGIVVDSVLYNVT